MNMTTTSFIREIFDRHVEVEPPSVEEEAVLIQAAQDGDPEASVAIFYLYAPAMRGAALRALAPLGHSATLAQREEARSLAVLGIMEAIAKHDVSRGTRLASTAKFTLREAYDEIDWAGTSPFSIPSKTVRRFFALMAAADQDLDVALEICLQHKLTPETTLALYRALRAAGSYDALSQDDGEEMDDALTYASSLWDGDVDDIVEAEEAIMVRDALAVLEDDEEDAVRLLYGFDTDDGQPLTETLAGMAMGKTRTVVRKLKASAMPKMRAALGVQEAPADEEGPRPCRKCQQTKPVDEFRKGRHVCIECARDANREQNRVAMAAKRAAAKLEEGPTHAML